MLIKGIPYFYSQNMKTLYIIRHAKSDWSHPFVKDIDRPLNARGWMDAYRMNRWMIQNKIRPDAVCCSPATRAYSTASIVLRNIIPFEDHSRFMIFEELYEKSSSDYIEFIRRISDFYSKVMIFGHNSAITHTVNALGVNIENVPTCGFFAFESNAETWKQFPDSQPKVIQQIFPSELK
jgi:phosphohistidine phosphatase